MNKRPKVSLDEMLQSLFDAERAARRHHQAIARSDRAQVVAAVGAQIEAARRERDETEASLRLLCLARVLGEFDGARVVDLLIDILAVGSPEAGGEAAEVLTDLAFGRFKEVALGVERALDRLPPDSEARSELPFVLLEVPEPGVAKLLAKMLEQADATAVGAAIEACAELGDPALVPSLERLVDDKRLVDIDDDEGESDTVEIGQLAREALEMLSGGERG